MKKNSGDFMGIYYESLEHFMQKGGLKQTTITAKQILPAIVAHMVRMDRKFTLHVNGRLSKPLNEMLDEVFELCHLQQPFYTQHCASRKLRYVPVSKNRVKIEFTFSYRMSREEEKWVVNEIDKILQIIIGNKMTDIEKIIVVHDYIVRNYQYEMNTTGSPFTVLTFMKEGQGVCMAYALLFEKMLSMLNINCLYVVGKAIGESDIGHAWNMVELEGHWYHIDTTWNDLGSRSNKYEIRYRYFLKTDEFMRKDHTWQFDHYPSCTSNRFDYLQEVYDAAYYDGSLYSNHQGIFSRLNLTTFAREEVLPITIQHCVVNGDRLWFSNMDDFGYLYEYNLNTKDFIRVEENKVIKIKKTLENTTVYYESKIDIVKEPKNIINNHIQECVDIKPNVVIPFIHYENNWIGTHEGSSTSIAFSSEKGIKIDVLQPFEQLTAAVTIINNVLELSFTCKRKSVHFNELNTKLWIPFEIMNNGEKAIFTSEHGEEISYKVEAEHYILSIERGGKIIMQ